jgi:EAL domain-containing protein (putative c-di-GMP-specific phosphodiesterase class I)
MTFSVSCKCAASTQARVVFEVTERAAGPLSRIARQIEAIRERGFGVAIDDVGAGNSGLEMLRMIKFDYIKIDRSVLIDAVGGGSGRAVILAILAFGRESGSFMIAEGVETDEMLESIRVGEQELAGYWIQGVQGFLFGKPGPSIARFLADQAPGLKRSVDLLRDSTPPRHTVCT